MNHDQFLKGNHKKEGRRFHYKADQSKKSHLVQYKNTNSQNNYGDKVGSILCGSGEILRSSSMLMALMLEGLSLCSKSNKCYGEHLIV